MAWRKPRIFRVDVYDVEIELFDNIALAIKWTEKYQVGVPHHEVTGAEGFASELARPDGCVVIALCIPPTKHRATLLAHEVAHAAHMIFDSRSVPISLENTEALAYLQDCIFRNCAKHLGMQT